MSNENKNAPVDKFQDYPVEVAIFPRQGENGTWYNAQVSKTYKQGDDYKRTNNFNRNDLLKLNALVPQALARMQELEQGQERTPARSNGQDMNAIKDRAQARIQSQSQGQSQSQDQGQGH